MNLTLENNKVRFYQYMFYLILFATYIEVFVLLICIGLHLQDPHKTTAFHFTASIQLRKFDIETYVKLIVNVCPFNVFKEIEETFKSFSFRS